jgi:predicted Zn-dependent protease
MARRGHRFIAPVQTEQAPKTLVAFDAVLQPHRVFIDTRAALETLDRGEIARALPALEQLARSAPHLVAGHIGIANACVMLYESTRFDAQRDAATLQKAEHHAREACRLDPSSGEPWSTLAFVLFLQGNARDAVAAAYNAISLESDDWRHHLALAFVSWGEERLRAAHKVSKLCPGLALAHWLAATVFIARQAFDAAVPGGRAGAVA